MSVAITQIAGTIDTDEKSRLKKLLFRSTRGKALTYFYDMPLDNSKPLDLSKLPPKQRSVYVVVFQDGRQIRDRIIKVCDSFMGQRFDVPALSTLKQKMVEIRRHIDESKNLRITSRKFLRNYLIQIN